MKRFGKQQAVKQGEEEEQDIGLQKFKEKRCSSVSDLLAHQQEAQHKTPHSQSEAFILA